MIVIHRYGRKNITWFSQYFKRSLGIWFDQVDFANHKPIEKEDILFTYAVMFYQVLTGVHPYGGTILSAPYDKCVEIGQCIDNDLFAFGSKAEYITFPESFNLHSTFHTLSGEIQELFKRAFGTASASRPTLEEWGKGFYNCVVQLDSKN